MTEAEADIRTGEIIKEKLTMAVAHLYSAYALARLAKLYMSTENGNYVLADVLEGIGQQANLALQQWIDHHSELELDWLKQKEGDARESAEQFDPNV